MQSWREASSGCAARLIPLSLPFMTIHSDRLLPNPPAAKHAAAQCPLLAAP
ncbi:hypothetical protein [Paenibacillus wulumuqiensis]|uniref:hypothetical protein n=1 Tax=Paenibacillus wulumuqiensis TaxID=1567107 RepID=UPI000AA59CCD|nr:hypothetical protein [Paenibacillus wulumuqiensis]